MRAPAFPRLLLALLAAVATAGLASAGCSGGDDAAGEETSAKAVASATCDTCHMGDFRGAAGHEGKRPTKCAVCHVKSGWHPTGLHHDFWPLTGKHEKVACFDCHKDNPPSYHGTDKACIACHAREYDGAPGHAGHFPTTCEECHSTTAWKPLLPEHAQPPAPSAAPSTPPPSAPTATSWGIKPPPHSPKPTPRPAPTKPTPTPTPTPTVEPTSNASKRL